MRDGASGSVAIESDTMDRRCTGTGVYARNMVRHLLGRDEGLKFHLFHSNHTADPLYGRVEELLIPGVRSPCLSLLLSNTAFYLRHRRQFDIVHFPRQTVYPLFWLLGRETVVSIHDAGYLLFPRTRDGNQCLAQREWYRVTARMRDWSLKYGHRFVAAVISPSESAKREVAKEYGIPTRKICVIPYGRDESFRRLDNRDAVRQEVRCRHAIDGPFILNVGRIQPHKNVGRLVEAFALLKRKWALPHKLVIVGQAFQGEGEIFSLVRELGIGSQVVFPGEVSQKELVLWYNAAEMFVYPSLHEGFGLPLVEAMSCGTPVITSNVTSMPEVVGDAGLLVDPRNVGEIAEAMARLLRSPELRGELSARSLRRAHDFSWDGYAREVMNLYRNLLGVRS